MAKTNQSNIDGLDNVYLVCPTVFVAVQYLYYYPIPKHIPISLFI